MLWSVGIPLVSVLLLRRHRNELESLHVREKFGFLYNGYAPRSYYWEAVMSGRKVVVAFVSIFLTGQGTMLQALVLFVVLIFSIFLSLRVSPFLERNVNRLEVVSLLALVVTVYCGIFFLSARNPANFIHGKDFALSDSHKWVLFLAIILSNGVFISLWIYRLLGHLRDKLLTRFPGCYRFFCLCCSHPRLARHQLAVAHALTN